ncbi:Rieske 2Fe-2S domain-containing protein [Pseudomonas protegens]|uniref:Rieske 2Fe-2S domain-containing protein n=1 Tax=Pseudomonas protegens TaxID=380021 RepID=UPI001F07EB2D|nr:Rieske 2Fe-2S domain-containing protein [Pseudomonas protegens]
MYWTQTRAPAEVKSTSTTTRCSRCSRRTSQPHRLGSEEVVGRGRHKSDEQHSTGSSERQEAFPGAYDATTRVAASWYVNALARPQGQAEGVDALRRPCVAWRGATGRAVVMDRHCSHLGANLADGRVRDGCIQCPFHHWRYDEQGKCVHIPGTARRCAGWSPCRAGRAPTLVTTERYGYVWVWYGSPQPLHRCPKSPRPTSTTATLCTCTSRSRRRRRSCGSSRTSTMRSTRPRARAPDLGLRAQAFRRLAPVAGG